MLKIVEARCLLRARICLLNAQVQLKHNNETSAVMLVDSEIFGEVSAISFKEMTACCRNARNSYLTLSTWKKMMSFLSHLPPPLSRIYSNCERIFAIHDLFLPIFANFLCKTGYCNISSVCLCVSNSSIIEATVLKIGGCNVRHGLTW